MRALIVLALLAFVPACHRAEAASDKPTPIASCGKPNNKKCCDFGNDEGGMICSGETCVAYGRFAEACCNGSADWAGMKCTNGKCLDCSYVTHVHCAPCR